ncbi:MAG: phospholipid carrier-dependent glycosyltransferase [Tepidisphaeraceae bacterium]
MEQAAAVRNRLWVQRGAALLLAVAALAGSFYLNTRHNTFPDGFHPDEPFKADQILSLDGHRNFRHPQLMLEVTQRVFDLGRTPRDVQAVTVLGRGVSAFFAAVAIAAICLTGYLAGGLWGEILLGLSGALCSSLVVYAHYFKEDAALAMGMCVVLLGTCWMMKARSHFGQSAGVILLGVGCAIAASSKYIGIVFVIAGLAAVIAAPSKRWQYRLWGAIAFLLIAGFCTAAINYRIFIDPAGFSHGFGFEAEHVTTSHFGLALNRPNVYYIATLPIETGWPIVLLGSAAIPMLLITWRKRSGWDVMASLFGPGFLLVLSLSKIPNTRYLLPAAVMTHVMAGLFALWVIQSVANRTWRAAAGIAFATVVLLIGLPRCVSVVHQFGDDSRDRLRAWMVANLPAKSIVVGDFYTGMVIHAMAMRGEDTIGNGITVRERFAATFFGQLSSLPGKGIGYVAVADLAYDRYFQPDIRPTDDFKQEYDYNRQWYVDLFTNYKPLWSYDPEMNLRACTNPAIRLYRIDGR